MTWTTSNGIHTATAAGLQFVLEPTPWSIWSLDQAKASADHLANLKACGLNPWTPEATARLFYRHPAEEQKEHHGARACPSRSKRVK